MAANPYCSDKFAGIHLAGSNSSRTAVAILRGDPLKNPLDIIGLYEKIGSFGKLFSDDRLIEILRHEGPLKQIFIDCPMSQPPCVSCSRPRCPGATSCDDISVAYMLALSEKAKLQGRRKKRPINPQSQRIWDVERVVEDRVFHEPSYSANMAPLVTRALVLQRRLKMIDENSKIYETSVDKALSKISSDIGLKPSHVKAYKSFDQGVKVRQGLIKSLVCHGWLSEPNHEIETQITKSIDAFQALITGLVAGLYSGGLTQEKPSEYLAEDGWVYLPELSIEFS